MQSYSKVIKYSNINGDAIISPPVFEISTKKESIEQMKESPDVEIVTSSEIIEEANRKAKDIIDEANNKARQMINDTEVKIQEIYKSTRDKAYNDGYMQGYQEGYKKGMEEAAIQAEEMKKNAENLVRMADHEVKNYLMKKEKEIISLAVKIAEAVIKLELSINPEAVFNIAKNVIAKTIDKSQILVKINPKDINFLKQRKEELEIFVENPNDLIFLADETIKEGNVYAETPSGFIDGRIDTQLDMILENLLRNDFDVSN